MPLPGEYFCPNYCCCCRQSSSAVRLQTANHSGSGVTTHVTVYPSPQKQKREVDRHTAVFHSLVSRPSAVHPFMADGKYAHAQHGFCRLLLPYSGIRTRTTPERRARRAFAGPRSPNAKREPPGGQEVARKCRLYLPP